MKNLGGLMKQAQKMQENMARMKEELDDMEIEGSAGAGMVTVVLTGKGHARKVTIDPSLGGAEDITVLEDLLVAAINDAKSKAEAQVQEKMQEMTGGLQLPPGMEFPF